VDVVDVDRLDAEVLAALVDLVAQVRGGHAVRVVDEIVERRDPVLDERLLEPRGGIGRGLALEREVAALGAQENLVARELAGGDAVLQRAAERPLRALEAVVDRAVEDVDALRDRAARGLRDGGVGRVVPPAEVRAHPDGRERDAEVLPPVSVRGGMGLGELEGAFRGRASWNHADDFSFTAPRPPRPCWAAWLPDAPGGRRSPSTLSRPRRPTPTGRALRASPAGSPSRPCG
jgi:hypothetical protein